MSISHKFDRHLGDEGLYVTFAYLKSSLLLQVLVTILLLSTIINYSEKKGKQPTVTLTHTIRTIMHTLS